MNNTHWSSWLVNIGLLLVAVGVVMPLLGDDLRSMTFRYVYASGAVLALLGRLFAPAFQGSDLRLKRMVRLQSWSAIFFCVAAFFSFYETTSLRDWLAFTLAGGAVQAIASVMIGLRLRKLGK